MIKKLTDAEVAVIIDALVEARFQARRSLAGSPGEEDCTPNIDSALAKVNGMMSPSTNGLWICDDESVDWEEALGGS